MAGSVIRWFRPTCGLAFALLLAGCGDGSAGKNANDAKSPETKPESTPAPAEKRPPAQFALKAESFYKEYRADHEEALKKYAGKLVELSGEVDYIGLLPGSGPVFNLKGEAENPVAFVACVSKEPEPWARISPHQTVKVRGRVVNNPFECQLEECEIVEAGPSPALSAQAVDFAKEFAADSDTAHKKYDRKWIILEGEVSEKKPDEEDVIVILRGDGETHAACAFRRVNKEQTDALSTGQQIKLIGICVPKTPGEKSIRMEHCLLITRAESN